MRTLKLKSTLILSVLFNVMICSLGWSDGALRDIACQCKQQGDEFLQKGQMHEAIASYQQALASQSNLPAAWFNMAIACYAQRDLDRASFALRRLLRLQPDDAEAHYNLGCLNLYRGNINEARTEFQRAKTSMPSELFLSEQIDRALNFLDLFENSSALQQRKILQMLQDGLQPLTSA